MSRSQIARACSFLAAVVFLVFVEHTFATHPDTRSFQRIDGQGARVWSDTTGKHRLNARLIGLTADWVRLETPAGGRKLAMIARLSNRDQRYLDQARKAIARPHSKSTNERPSVRDREASISTADVVVVHMSGDFLARFATRPIFRTSEVDVCILGRPVQGPSITKTIADVRLVPNASQATLELPLRGLVRSNTTTIATPALLHNTATTYFQSTLQLTMDESGVRLIPGDLRAWHNIQNTGITSTARMDRLVRRVAARRYNAQKDEANRIAAGITERSINESIEQAARRMSARLRELTSSSVLAWSELSEGAELHPRFATMPDGLEVVMAQTMQGGKVGSPPAEQESEAPFHVHLHSSVINRAMSDEARLASLEPKLNEILSRYGNATKLIREVLDQGELHIEWTEDEEWMTVEWRPF